jgi:hypothetical protein
LGQDAAMVNTKLSRIWASIVVAAGLLVGGLYYHSHTSNRIWKNSKSKADMVLINALHQHRDSIGLTGVAQKARARHDKITAQIKRADANKKDFVENKTRDPIDLARKYAVFDRFTETYAELSDNDVDDNPNQRIGGNLPSTWDAKLTAQEREAVNTGKEGRLALTLRDLSKEVGRQNGLISFYKGNIQRFRNVAPTFFKGAMGEDIGRVQSSLQTYLVTEDDKEISMRNTFTTRQRGRIKGTLYRTDGGFRHHSDHHRSLSNFDSQKLRPTVETADRIVASIESMQNNHNSETVNLGLAAMHTSDVESVSEIVSDGKGGTTTKYSTKIVDNSGPYRVAAAAFAVAAADDEREAKLQSDKLKKLLPGLLQDPVFSNEDLRGLFKNLGWKPQETSLSSGLGGAAMDIVLPPLFNFAGNLASDNGNKELRSIEPLQQVLHSAQGIITTRINNEARWIEHQIDEEINHQVRSVQTDAAEVSEEEIRSLAQEFIKAVQDNDWITASPDFVYGFLRRKKEFSDKKDDDLRLLARRINSVLKISYGRVVLKDAAMFVRSDDGATKGGIDFEGANLKIIKRNDRGMPLPLAQQDMAQLSHIQGFDPEIIEIKPMSGILSILSELRQRLQTIET